MTTITIILTLAVIVCVFIAYSLAKKQTVLQQQTADFREENARLRSEIQFAHSVKEENDQLKEQLATLRQVEAENASLKTRLQMSDEQKVKAERENELRFKSLADQILKSNSEQFRTANESRLEEILAPLRENIDNFKKRIEDNFIEETKQRVTLETRIAELRQLNESLNTEARDLTQALRGKAKIQGDWGEMILESILESSGLQKGVHFTVQQTADGSGRTLRNDEGRGLRPDVVVNYPGNRCVVIDSKVSLTAFVDMVNADDADEQKRRAKDHVLSVRKHVDELQRARYQDYIGDRQMEFVFMFIPNEPAYISAMQTDTSLWQYAFDRKVIILSPTHLLTVLSLVAQMWNQDKIIRNSTEIALESGRMYDKFVRFLDDMESIRKALDKARDAYDSAMSKLSTGRGTLTDKAEKIRKLGAKATKSIPQDYLPDADVTENDHEQ